MIYMVQIMRASATLLKQTVGREEFLKEKEANKVRRSNMTEEQRYREDWGKVLGRMR